MQELWVRSLGQEDPLEKEMATHNGILAWRIPWTEDLAGYSPWGCKELDMTELWTVLWTVELEQVFRLPASRSRLFAFPGPSWQTFQKKQGHTSSWAREGTRGSFDMWTWGTSRSQRVRGATFCWWR